MARQKRKFSREFKMEAVGRVLEGDRSLTAVAREIGVSNVVLARWRNQFLSEGPSALMRLPMSSSNGCGAK